MPRAQGCTEGCGARKLSWVQTKRSGMWAYTLTSTLLSRPPSRKMYCMACTPSRGDGMLLVTAATCAGRIPARANGSVHAHLGGVPTGQDSTDRGRALGKWASARQRGAALPTHAPTLLLGQAPPSKPSVRRPKLSPRGTTENLQLLNHAACAGIRATLSSMLPTLLLFKPDAYSREGK